MGARGPVKRKAAPKLRIVGLGESELQAEQDNDTATALVKPGKPVAPQGMSAQGAELWESLADRLDDAGLLSPVDGPALDLAVRAYLVAVDASDLVLQEGATSTGSMGQAVAHPGVAAFAKATSVYLEASKQLGLTFAARARITVTRGDDAGTDDSNPFAGDGSAATGSGR